MKLSAFWRLASARAAGAIVATALVAFGVVRLPAQAAAPYPEALYRAISKADSVAGCASLKQLDALAYVRGISSIATTQLGNGRTIFTAYVHDECICGDGNCIQLAFVQAGPDAYRPVLSTSGFGSDFRSDGTFVIEEHDSAAVAIRDQYRFDGNVYRLIGDRRVYVATGVTKPVAPIAVHFSPGSYTATERGTVYEGFEDTYSVTGSAGQTLAVGVTAIHGSLDRAGVRIYDKTDPNRAYVNLNATKSLSWRGRLPETGRYEISIDGGEETLATYALTLEIR